ncbi:hypothetical protein LEN26_020231 [Aphanomyces euteiches]|nr:hypothetical protein LEN26_020231 [Aphanomyces euteiches]KAH9116815.1 hypothetical protein AeMF1_009272 [Aphanomyces euteiches]
MGNQASSPRKKRQQGGLQSLIQQDKASEEPCPSRLTPAMFQFQSVGHHGLPSQPTVVCYVPMLGLLAVATGYQQLKVYGQDGLEVYLPCRKEKSHSAGATATFLEYTSSGKLVLVMSDSAVQVIDLALLQEGKSVVVAELPPSWTTCRITALETIRHHKTTPFFYLALDDGSVQVVQETTCQFAMYAIQPSDVGVATSTDNDAIFVSAMACNPSDPNQLLLAYEDLDVVFLWDIAKQKVIGKTVSSAQSDCAVRSLAWHISGKRFAVGFENGALGVFRSDKQQQALYKIVGQVVVEKPLPISRIDWISTNAAIPGAIVFAGGHYTKGLTICYPSRDGNDRGPKEMLSELTSNPNQFPWKTMLVPTHNESGVMDFVTVSRVVPAASSSFPFTSVVLSGNPMEGCKPSVGVVPLPCSVVAPFTPKEEWIWLDSPPLAQPLPSTTLQSSDLLAMQLVTLRGTDGSFRDELFTSCDQVPESAPLGGWESPIMGGFVEQVKPQLPPDVLDALEPDQYNRASLMVTGHHDSRIRIWEMLSPTDGTSRGLLNLLHVVDVKTVLRDPISAVCFSPLARLLLVGTSSGEFGVFTFQDGFHFVFSLHVHSSAIEYFAHNNNSMVAMADAFGVVSIVNLKSQEYKLAIFDISTEEAVSVNSLLIHGSSLFVGRGNGHVDVYHLESAECLLECSTGSEGLVSAMLLIDEDGALIEAAAPPPRESPIQEDSPIDSSTKALVDQILETYPPTNETSFSLGKTVSVCVEAGPLGIFLVDDIGDRAVLKGFVPEDANAELQVAKGIVPGSTLVEINGVDVRRLKRTDIIAVVGSLVDVAKQLTYTLPEEQTASLVLCSVGRSIQLFVMPPPSADKRTTCKVETQVQVGATVVAMAVCSVPVEGSMENTLIVVDQSGFIYILALPSLHLIWSALCPSELLSGYAFDHMHVHINPTVGEIVLCTCFGDVARYSVFGNDMASEVTMLQSMTSRTKLTTPSIEVEAEASEKRAAGGGGFLKLFAAKEIDLNTVFVVPSIEEDERKQLMGDRSGQPPPQPSATSNMAGTMDALQQASQNLHLRGEKLSGLEEKTERLKNRADEFYQTMKAFNDKEAKKKWYQL